MPDLRRRSATRSSAGSAASAGQWLETGRSALAANSPIRSSPRTARRWRWALEGAGQRVKAVQTFTIITGPPNELVAPIQNRMTVILPPEAWRMWLGEEGAEPDELLALLLPHPAVLMRAYAVGQRVGNVKNNDPALLQPAVLAA